MGSMRVRQNSSHNSPALPFRYRPSSLRHRSPPSSRSPLKTQFNFHLLPATCSAVPAFSPRNRNAPSKPSPWLASPRKLGIQPKPDSPPRSAANSSTTCCTLSGQARQTASARAQNCSPFKTSLLLSQIMPAAFCRTKCRPARNGPCRNATSRSKRLGSSLSSPSGSAMNPHVCHSRSRKRSRTPSSP